MSINFHMKWRNVAVEGQVHLRYRRHFLLCVTGRWKFELHRSNPLFAKGSDATISSFIPWGGETLSKNTTESVTSLQAWRYLHK